MASAPAKRALDERNFANLFRQTPEMICITGGPEHRFELVNEAHIRALGFDATGRTVRDAQPESVEVHGILDEVYRSGKTAELREIAVTVTDRVRYFDLTCAARRDANDVVDGIMIMSREVSEQVLARRALQHQEERLTLALASSKVGFFDWNIVDDSVLFSDQMRADWGLVDAARKMTLGDAVALIHEDDRERAKRHIETAMTERVPYQIEYRVVRPDGRTIWVEVRGRVHYDPGGRAVRFFGTSLDVSARAENERSLRALADSMPQVVWAARPDGVLDYTNERWTEYSGSSDPLRWLDFVNPAERDDVVSTWGASIATGERYETKFRLLRAADQTYRWHLVRANPAFDDAGNITRWFGTCTDIEDQTRSEELARFLADASAVLGSSLNYQTTLANVTRMAVPMVADWATAEMVDADGSIRRLAVAHIDPAKVSLAHELWQRWPAKPDDVGGVAEVIRTGKAQVFAEIPDALLVESVQDPELLRAIRALGLTSWMSVPLTVRGKTLGALSFVFAESGRRFGATDLQLAEDLARRVGVAIDNAHLYEAAVTARQHADAANRLKDEFLATVSHELRTPLNAMLGWTRMLRGGDLAPERRDRALETIERNAVTQAQLIEDLLDVARIISGKLRLDAQSVEIAHIVEHAVDALKLASDTRKIEVVTALDPAAGQVVGDPHRLGQVMWNLLSNAIKFTPRGGRVHVVVERVDSTLRITVRDTGKGIAPDFLPYVFDRFKQEDGATTRAHGGLGLGLAISRHIVELHGGSIAVSSKGEGQGATFVVTLPMSPLRTQQRATSSRLASSVGAPIFTPRPELIGLKILVVDDELDSRELVAAILAQCGAILRLASSVAEALTLLEEDLPDLILSDIGMPSEDGYELIRRVRALPRAAFIPAAALTAYARAEDRSKALDAGYMMHIPKPVEPAELVAVMANLQRFALRAQTSG